MSNTLNSTITSKFFATENGYATMRQRWSTLVNDKEARKELTASHHALYLALSGKSLNKAFTPITQQTKLDNGMSPYGGVSRAISGVWSYDYATRTSTLNAKLTGMFGDLLSPDAVKLLRTIWPTEYTEDGDLSYNTDSLMVAERAATMLTPEAKDSVVKRFVRWAAGTK